MRRIIIIAILAMGIAVPARGQFDFRTTGARAARVWEITCTPTAAPAVSADNTSKLFVPCAGVPGYSAGNTYISQDQGAWTLLSSFAGVGAIVSVFGRIGTITAVSGDYGATLITFTPSGGIAATNVGTAITELDAEKISASETATLSNKTIALGSNTMSGTTGQFNTALTDGDFATLAGTETLSGKTLTTPTIASFTNAAHNHTNAAGGAQLTDAALSAVVGVAKGGTGANMAATGGSGHIVKQASAGVAFSTGTLSSTDLTNDAALVKTTGSSMTGPLSWGAGTTTPVTIDRDGAIFQGTVSALIDARSATGSMGVLLGWNSALSGGVIVARGGTGSLQFWTHNGTAYAERMRLTATGNLGLGSGTPSSPSGFAPFHDIRGAAPALILTDTDDSKVTEVGVNSGSFLVSTGGGIVPFSLVHTGSVNGTLIVDSGVAKVIALKVGSSGTTVVGHFSSSASLDYAQASANTCETLTLAVAGSIEGSSNHVAIGVPNALATHNTTATLFSWVSAANTVSVRRCVISADGSNPAAATVRAAVTQY